MSEQDPENTSDPRGLIHTSTFLNWVF